MAFSGTSITEAQPTGYRPLTEAALKTLYNTAKWRYELSAYSGSSTWVRLWYMQADLLDTEPLSCIVYEAVSANYVDEYAEQAKAIEEAAIRRLRTGHPGARIIVLGMPLYVNNTTPTLTNSAQLVFLETLCAQYGMTYVDWSLRVQDLLDAETYALNQLYADTVHPTSTGHAEIKNLLLETLTLSFVKGVDDWTGDLNDYPRQYDDGTFEDTNNYIARDATDNDGATGTWTTDGTTLVSSEADATVTFTGTFETFGVDLDLSQGAFTLAHSLDGGGFNNGNFLSGGRSINQLAPNFLTRGEHTLTFKVVSGTVRIRRFLAI